MHNQNDVNNDFRPVISCIKASKNQLRLAEIMEIISVVAKMITELSRFEPELCICNGDELDFKRESVSGEREIFCRHCHRPVSVMESNYSGSVILYLFVINLHTTVRELNLSNLLPDQ